MDAFDNFMIFIALIGNLFLYFQAFSLFQQRAHLSWEENGANVRLISYIYSIIISLIWVIYAGVNSSWSVFISSFEAMLGSSISTIIIVFYSIKNTKPKITDCTIEQPLVDESTTNPYE